MITLFGFIRGAKDPEEKCVICRKDGQEIYSGKIKDIPEQMQIDTYIAEWSTALGCMQIFIDSGQYSRY